MERTALEAPPPVLRIDKQFRYNIHPFPLPIRLVLLPASNMHFIVHPAIDSVSEHQVEVHTNMARTRYRFSSEQKPYFITNTIVAWLPVFSYPQHADIILDSWRFLQRERDIEILGWVIMENHIHWIASGPDLGKRVGEFKSYTATTILQRLASCGYKTILQELSFYKLKHKTDQNHQLWQEGSHPQEIDSEEVAWQKIEYIHNNPLRRGYIDDPLHWRYSSARSYAGQRGLLDICVDWR